MQKKKQVFTWPISVLVIVVSFLSVLVVLGQVQAAWVDPYYFPSETNVANNFVFTPLAENLVLGSKSITGTGTGGINIAGPVTAGAGSFTTLTVGGIPVSGGGGGSSGSDWFINYNYNRALNFTTTTGSGNVGIGTTTPVTKLHIHDGASGPIVTLSGSNNNYKGLTIKNELGVEQWFAGSNNNNNYVVRRNGATDYFNVNANTGNINVAQDLSVGVNLAVTGSITAGAASFTSLSVAGAPYVPGGGGSGSDWATLNGSLYYTTSTGNGKVGIGTNAPNKLLHLYSTSPNAELDIQSTATAGSHWAMYHDAGTDQLRFWKSAGNNVLTLGANGRIGVGTTPDNANMLKASTASVGVVGLYGENSSTDLSYMVPPFTNVNPNNVGVKGVAYNDYAGGIGVSGLGFYGVNGMGTYGLYGESDTPGGIGLWVKQGAGSRAALLQGQTDIEGLLKVTGNIQMIGSDNFVYVTSGAGAPASTCSIGGSGKIYVDSTNFRFYICTGASGWKYKTFDNL